MTTLEILFLTLIILGAAGLALWQYNPSKRQPNWRILAFLRFMAYMGIGLLLLNFKLIHKETFLEKPRLAVAVDNSTSIGVLKGQEKVRDWVDKIGDNQDLNEKFDVHFYSFGKDFKVLDSLNFSEGETDISSVFINLDHLYKNTRVPTILISDGNQTVGKAYEQVAQRYESPISAVVVGDTTTYTDLEISRVNANRYSFLDNTFPVEVFVNYTGTQAVSKKLTIYEGNTALYQKKLDFGSDKAAIITAKLKAQSVGVHTYKVVIDTLTNEKNTVNNSQNFAVEVMDQQTAVLILSPFDHPDLGAFKKSIESNKQQTADIQILQSEEDEVDLEKYQLVLLYQPNSSFTNVYDRISKAGINTFTVTGTATDYNFLNRHQNDFEKERTGTQEYYEARYHAGYHEFQFDDIGFEDFPPLQDVFGDLTMLTDYSPLLFQTINAYETDTPLLLTLQQGNNRRAYLFGENSWQWRAKNYRDRESFEEYDAFIGQIVQYLASDKKRERLEIEYNSFYNTGDKIVFRAHYFDENYQFDPRGNLEARVVHKETKTAQTYPLVLKNDHYELDLGGLDRGGEYTFTITAEGQNLSKSGAFTLVDFDPEKQFMSANYKKLKQIAPESTFLVEENPEKLITALLEDSNYKPIQKSKTTKSSLINWKYLFFIILAALTAEWFIRKYRGLI